MSKYCVTGSTGALGSIVIEKLISLGVNPADIVALARDKSKADGLLSRGLDVRIADYSEPETLDAALKGVEKLLLISGSEVGRRFEQHGNVIRSAVKNEVKLLVYTSIFHADVSVSPLADEHRNTEALIKSSGLSYVILRNSWYTENYLQDVAVAGKTGVIEAAAGKGKVTSASRKDYAEAAAKVMTGDIQPGKIYELAGDPWDYDQLAAAASEATGRSIAYHAVTVDNRIKTLLAAGLPEGIAGFVASLDESISAGALDGSSGDLEAILGRKPESLVDGLKSALA